mmetsp:Transcript_63921/g.187497  ORF Transcript_63921/g.187497 Transcript_63921/m.187497 type:complete len:419 (+) Transcript_63921:635-1891(+)
MPGVPLHVPLLEPDGVAHVHAGRSLLHLPPDGLHLVAEAHQDLLREVVDALVEQGPLRQRLAVPALLAPPPVHHARVEHGGRVPQAHGQVAGDRGDVREDTHEPLEHGEGERLAGPRRHRRQGGLFRAQDRGLAAPHRAAAGPGHRLEADKGHGLGREAGGRSPRRFLAELGREEEVRARARRHGGDHAVLPQVGRQGLEVPLVGEGGHGDHHHVGLRRHAGVVGDGLRPGEHLLSGVQSQLEGLVSEGGGPAFRLAVMDGERDGVVRQREHRRGHLRRGARAADQHVEPVPGDRVPCVRGRLRHPGGRPRRPASGVELRQRSKCPDIDLGGLQELGQGPDPLRLRGARLGHVGAAHLAVMEELEAQVGLRPGQDLVGRRRRDPQDLREASVEAHPAGHVLGEVAVLEVRQVPGRGLA